jgi:DNA-3-methyladenine glycosylase II
MQELRADPILTEVIDAHEPLTLEPAEDPFERLVVSIVNQQLSTASANAIRGRLFDRFEIAPEPLLKADETELRDVGLSRQKIEYIQNTARTFTEDDLTRDSFTGMTNQEVIEELTTIRGVGVWTAKMFLMFSLGREDVFPVEDLGIRNGMTELYGDLSREEMVEAAEQWRPYRSITSLYLWRSYEDTPTET